MGKTISSAFKGVTKAISQPINSGLNILKGKGNIGDLLSVGTLFAPGGNLAQFSFGKDTFRKATLDSIGKNFLASRGIKIGDSFDPTDLTGANILKLAQSSKTFVPGADLLKKYPTLAPFFQGQQSAVGGSGSSFGGATAAGSGQLSALQKIQQANHLEMLKRSGAILNKQFDFTNKNIDQFLLAKQNAADLLGPSGIDRLARDFRNRALANADRAATRQAAQIAPGGGPLAASIRLAQMNQATQAANQNRANLFSPQSMAEARLKQAQILDPANNLSLLSLFDEFNSNIPFTAPATNLSAASSTKTGSSSMGSQGQDGAILDAFLQIFGLGQKK